ncbi:hypothetical protein GOODEAATRI_005653 [Goodea atripinnis]|uniref:Uncharacterized protein n=1 Tax=Goodea atripinnis TaxID=208336 RepID=A0ABV0MFP0_9TELE
MIISPSYPDLKCQVILKAGTDNSSRSENTWRQTCQTQSSVYTGTAQASAGRVPRSEINTERLAKSKHRQKVQVRNVSLMRNRIGQKGRQEHALQD